MSPSNAPIPGYPNYTIAEDGTVTNTRTNHVLKPALNKKTGYLHVSLWKNNKGQSFNVHRLVAEAFIPNPDNLEQVEHRDDDKTNPHKNNLRWVTRSDNTKFAYDSGLRTRMQRKLSNKQLDALLVEFFAGKSLSTLAKQAGVGMVRFTVNMRRRSRQTQQNELYETTLIEQRKIRAIENIKKVNTNV